MVTPIQLRRILYTKMIGAILELLQWLPKITLFYWLLTLIGGAQYSVLFLVPAIALDVVDYIGMFT